VFGVGRPAFDQAAAGEFAVARWSQAGKDAQPFLSSASPTVATLQIFT
jgi:hypothetical protein